MNSYREGYIPINGNIDLTVMHRSLVHNLHRASSVHGILAVSFLFSSHVIDIALFLSTSVQAIGQYFEASICLYSST